LDGVETSVWTAAKDSIEFPLSRLTGEGERGCRDMKRRVSPELAERIRLFRKNPTPAEKLLWERLRDRKLGGFKFRRQHPLLGRFVVDFYCPEGRLVIELDGGVHRLRVEEDRIGQAERAGYRVLRFGNDEVLGNVEEVLDKILEALG